jgi:hypothetical protein
VANERHAASKVRAKQSVVFMMGTVRVVRGLSGRLVSSHKNWSREDKGIRGFSASSLLRPCVSH